MAWIKTRISIGSADAKQKRNEARNRCTNKCFHIYCCLLALFRTARLAAFATLDAFVSGCWLLLYFLSIIDIDPLREGFQIWPFSLFVDFKIAFSVPWTIYFFSSLNIYSSLEREMCICLRSHQYHLDCMVSVSTVSQRTLHFIYLLYFYFGDYLPPAGFEEHCRVPCNDPRGAVWVKRD